MEAPPLDLPPAWTSPTSPGGRRPEGSREVVKWSRGGWVGGLSVVAGGWWVLVGGWWVGVWWVVGGRL